MDVLHRELRLGAGSSAWVLQSGKKKFFRDSWIIMHDTNHTGSVWYLFLIESNKSIELDCSVNIWHLRSFKRKVPSKKKMLECQYLLFQGTTLCLDSPHASLGECKLWWLQPFNLLCVEIVYVFVCLCARVRYRKLRVCLFTFASSVQYVKCYQ